MNKLKSKNNYYKKIPIFSKINKNILSKKSPDHHKEEIIKLGKIIESYKITHYNKNGQKVVSYLSTPINKSKNSKLLIFFRGGCGSFAQSTPMYASVFLSYLASLGFTVITTNYRNKEECGGDEINDLYELLKIIGENKNFKFDKTKTTLFSYSKGSVNLIQFIAKKNIEFIKKLGIHVNRILIYAGTTDVNKSYIYRPELKEFRSKFYNTNEFENDKRSIIKNLDNLNFENVDTTIIHGTVDDNVNVNDVKELEKVSTEKKLPLKFIYLEGQRHSLAKSKTSVIEPREIIKVLLES